MSREYISWRSMRSRVLSPKSDKFHYYGGRGIRVCARWSRFVNFLADMGRCPPGLELDRIDNNGNYEPGNCRWATRVEQNRNRRNNRRLFWRGKPRTIGEIAEMEGVPGSRIKSRLDNGWSLKRAVSEPRHAKGAA
jgi:hypothetical protein